MGRTLLYLAIVALAAFVLAAVFVLDTGGGALETAHGVSVHDLSVEAEVHDGERVTAEGVLRRFTDPEEEFVLTESGLGVVVRGFNVQALRRLDGQKVTVTGRFGFDSKNGTYIKADSVTLAR
ncbi:MAG TPA: hypothetical protein VFT91_08975 [Dehalococcoidia bacterium]|nr:hypothetical protein [Dehalococcoidia bacterium]